MQPLKILQVYYKYYNSNRKRSLAGLKLTICLQILLSFKSLLFTENNTQKVINIEFDSKNSIQLLGIEIEITLCQVYCFLLEKSS